MSKAQTLATTVSTGNVLADGTVAYSEVSGTPTLPTFPSGDVVGTTDTQTLTNKTVTFADNTLTGVVPTSAIGVSVQAYDADTAKLDVAQTFTANQTVSADFKAIKYNESVGTITGSTLDFDTGNVFNHSISANTTYVFSNPPASGTAFGFTLKVTVTGTVAITWPTSVDWAGATAPDAPASGETDVYAFYTTDGGTTYYGFQAGDAMA